jgi:3-hydroxybutyryl-CoA dehydratase
MEVFKSIEITEKLVREFAKLVGDNNPIHLDKEYAKTTLFGRPIAHGILVSSFFSTLISEDYPGPGSIYLNQEMIFLKPCFVGDTVKVVVKLIEKENFKYSLSTRVYNSENNLIIDGKALILKK